MIIMIFILSILGFFVSWHIWRSKKVKQHLSCAIGSINSCDIVVKSKYNSLFRIPNEINGMLYYGLTATVSGIMMAGMFLIVSAPLIIVLIITGGMAVVFSVFLIIIQAFILKQWCEWCLVSAFLSILIFAFEALAFLS